MDILNKGNLVEIISRQNDITKTEATKVVEYFTTGIEEVIENGNKVNILGFGSFYVAENKAREGVNPKTGAKMNFAASKSAKFKAGAVLKKACNK